MTATRTLKCMRLKFAALTLLMLVGAVAFTSVSFRAETSSFNTSPDPITQPRGAGDAGLARTSATDNETPPVQGANETQAGSAPEPVDSASPGTATGVTGATGTPGADTETQPTTAPQEPASNPEALIALELVQAANKERSRAGLAPLEVSALLSEQATWWANYMPQGGYEHSSTERLNSIMDSGNYAAVGENLHAPEPQCPGLRDCPELRDQPTARVVLIDWVNSASHRDNLFDSRWGEVGIGIHCAADGKMWVAALFSSRDATEPKPAKRVTVPEGNQGTTCFGLKRTHNSDWQHP